MAPVDVLSFLLHYIAIACAAIVAVGLTLGLALMVAILWRSIEDWFSRRVPWHG